MLTKEDESLLRRDEIANISMLGFFSKQNPTKVFRKGNVLLAQGKSDEDWWYLSSSNDPKDFEWFIDKTDINDRFLATIEDPILDEVKKRFTCRWVLSCQRFYLPNEVRIPESKILVTQLSPSDAKHIYKNSNYKTYTSESYIEEQITNGPSVGFRDGSTLAGWALTHDDGALGALHVLDLYRRQGIARSLVVNLIRKVREMGQIPYTYVEASNTASLNLVKSLGFIFDRNIHWVNLNR